MSVEFTPWVLSEGDGELVVWRKNMTRVIVRLYRPGALDDLAEVRANANLIAAAPELYEALDYLLPCVGSPVPLPNTAERIRNAVAALRKARGEA